MSVMRRLITLWLALAAGITWYASAAEDDHAQQEIQKYRRMLQEGNPAELSELRGEELWTTPRGPKKATFERCDFGLGPGQIKGAYARLPRYFKDTGRVQDAESRLVHCMVVIQGMTLAAATRDWHRPNSDVESLITYLAAQSKGEKIDAPLGEPQEARMFAIGQELFYRRSGPLDFGCSTCHSLEGRRIRLQELADFAVPGSGAAAIAQWPAYRVSQGAVWTMERRLIDCIRQMRWPEPEYLSDALIALQVFLQHQAQGTVMEAPGLKR
jgi:sulfur-oxidizing protein SoxA